MADASIELAPYNDDQEALPFTHGRLQNSKLIARNIEDHYQAVRLASAFADLFGIKTTPTKIPPINKKPPRKDGAPAAAVEAPQPTTIPGVALPPPARVRTNPSKKR